MTTATDVALLCRELMQRSEQLRSMDGERIARALGRAGEILGSPHSSLGRRALADLPASSGLSAPMVRWALETTFNFNEADLLRLMKTAPSSSATCRLAAVILAGNVVTVPVRAMMLPLLFRSPVIAKASSDEMLMPSLIKEAITETDRELGAMVAVVASSDESRMVEGTLLTTADTVSVYGSDATMSATRSVVAPTTRLVEHGHGLGVLYVSRDACPSESAFEQLVTAIALDAGAYDQRGCLSPHAVLVERGFSFGARSLAERVARVGFADLERTLPRGPLSMVTATTQLQWRAVAAACGELFEGDGYATSYEGSRPPRVSCGHRNLAFLDCDDLENALDRVKPWSRHLKCVGVAGDASVLETVRSRLAHATSARVCEAGSMQTPRIDARHDGWPPWHGYRADTSLRHQ